MPKEWRLPDAAREKDRQVAVEEECWRAESQEIHQGKQFTVQFSLTLISSSGVSMPPGRSGILLVGYVSRDVVRAKGVRTSRSVIFDPFCR
jgi:hypothetical protein